MVEDAPIPIMAMVLWVEMVFEECTLIGMYIEEWKLRNAHSC
jgi:hypothetical protein